MTGSNMDEIWRDFYQTLLTDTLFEELPEISDKTERQILRNKLIHFAWLYNEIAKTGTKTPIDDLALKIGCSREEVGELVSACLESRLLCLPKRGSFRCELSQIAIRMISKMNIN